MSIFKKQYPKIDEKVQAPSRNTESDFTAPVSAYPFSEAYSMPVSGSAIRPAADPDSTRIVSPILPEGQAYSSQIPNGQPLEPVAGWLVCIAGPDQGKSFQIGRGRNTIGRNSAAPSDSPYPYSGPWGVGNSVTHNTVSSVYKISVSDPRVSRENAAGIISFDPRNLRYAVLPGDSERNMLYLNGDLVDCRMELHPYDKIEIYNSGTIFLFIPFCCEHFCWNYNDKSI